MKQHAGENVEISEEDMNEKMKTCSLLESLGEMGWIR
jgi:hypothetical protein